MTSITTTNQEAPAEAWWSKQTSKPTFWVFVASLAVILTATSGRWTEPPFNDAAFSVFPAALTLAETQFDYATLVRSPGFWEAGPGTHSISLVTLLAAIVLKLTSSSSAAFLILHLIHYAIAAGAIAMLHSWSRPMLGSRGALALSGATLLLPLFMTQASHMYLEMPVAFMTMLALTRFHSGHLLGASLAAAAAVWIKEPGIVVAAALTAACLLKPAPWSRRLKLAAAMATPSLLVFGVHFFVHSLSGGHQPPQTYGQFFATAWFYISKVPDLLAVVLAAALMTLWWSIGMIRACASRQPEAAPVDEAVARRNLSCLVLFMFAGFYLTVPLAVTIIILPRYYVAVLPLMMLAGADMARRVAGDRVVCGLLVCSMVVSVVNHRGRYYRFVSGNDAPTAERSMEYADLQETQFQVMAAAEKLPADQPVYYSLQAAFFSKHPAMNYVRQPLANGIFVPHEPKGLTPPLEKLPDHFHIIVMTPSGLSWTAQQAQKNPDYEVKVRTFTQGEYQSKLYEIRRLKKPADPADPSVTP